MKYKCLVFDHDDTVVNSTATIHHPCFQSYLRLKYPGRTCSFEEYMEKNFDPGFVRMCIDEYGMDESEIEEEARYWNSYVQNHIPQAYEGIRELMERHKAGGGLVCVSSHSMAANIRRDYAANALPQPDAVYGWELPMELRKPSPYALYEIMQKFSLDPSEILMIDDLKPGFDMANAAGVDFAGVGWSCEVASIESFMRSRCKHYFKTVSELEAFLA